MTVSSFVWARGPAGARRPSPSSSESPRVVTRRMMGSLLREWTERKADADDARGIVAGASRGVDRACASGTSTSLGSPPHRPRGGLQGAVLRAQVASAVLHPRPAAPPALYPVPGPC